MEEQKINPQHDKVRSTLRIVGPSLAAVGGVLTLIGMASFFSAFGSFGTPRYFWCAFLGIPLLGVGLTITKFAYMGAVFRYMAGETAPVGKDTFNYMAEGTKEGVRTVAHAVGEGLSSGMNESTPSKKLCTKCGVENDQDAKFCDNCGEQIGS